MDTNKQILALMEIRHNIDKFGLERYNWRQQNPPRLCSSDHPQTGGLFFACNKFLGGYEI